MFLCDTKATKRRQRCNRRPTGLWKTTSKTKYYMAFFIDGYISKQNGNQCFTCIWILIKMSFNCAMDKDLVFGEFLFFLESLHSTGRFHLKKRVNDKDKDKCQRQTVSIRNAPTARTGPDSKNVYLCKHLFVKRKGIALELIQNLISLVLLCVLFFPNVLFIGFCSYTHALHDLTPVPKGH